jgi:regulatory protein
MPRDRPACRRRAMDLLARREHSRLELERKLAARGFDEPDIGEVLDELEKEGLLSAERFAQSFVEARFSRGQGPYRIRRELAERGIEAPGAWIEDARFDWDRLAREARIKRFGAAPPANLREKARQVRFLEYRGFGAEQIRRALEFAED